MDTIEICKCVSCKVKKEIYTIINENNYNDVRLKNILNDILYCDVQLAKDYAKQTKWWDLYKSN